MAYKDSLDRKTMGDIEKQKKQDLLHTLIAPIDFEKIETVADLVDSFSGSSIKARNIGLCANVYKKMLTDPRAAHHHAGPRRAFDRRRLTKNNPRYDP